MRKACTQLGKDYKPAITFIVVQKRHHARFTVQNQAHAVSMFISPGQLFVNFELLVDIPHCDLISVERLEDFSTDPQSLPELKLFAGAYESARLGEFFVRILIQSPRKFS